MITSMRRAGRSTARLAATIALAVAPFVSAGRAEAQYGVGWGYGIGYNPNAYTDVNFLNSRALVNASAAAANRPQPLTAPTYQSRDDGFYDRYDAATRESMINRIARDPRNEMGTADPSGVLPQPPPSYSTSARPKAPPPPPRTMNLGNFFNQDHKLIWPGVSPISGDLRKKQDIADQAALAVLNEYQLNGLAQVSTVTDARQKLLDYGRPALKEVREKSTPALADSFHVFLLSLYGNLANAATVPKAK